VSIQPAKCNDGSGLYEVQGWQSEVILVGDAFRRCISTVLLFSCVLRPCISPVCFCPYTLHKIFLTSPSLHILMPSSILFFLA
jgi:hypothetical protein